MDNGLTNRTTIVDQFFSRIHEFTVTEVGSYETVFESPVTNGLMIVKDNDTGTIQFRMSLTAEVTDTQYSDYGQAHQTHTNVTSVCTVMSIRNDFEFHMVSATESTEWVRTKYNGNVRGIQTTMNMRYPELPNSEEMHFQRSTIDDYILEYLECSKIYEMVKYINAFGNVVQVSPNLRVSLVFK